MTSTFEPGSDPGFALLAEVGHDPGGLAAVALAEGQQELDSASCSSGATRTTIPRSIRAKPTVGGQQDVARVRVGVDEAVDEDLVEVGVEQLAGQGAAVGLQPGQRAERADVAALDQSMVSTSAVV